MRDGRFISTNFRYQIPRANIKDAGPYICSADNGLGQVTPNTKINYNHFYLCLCNYCTVPVVDQSQKFASDKKMLKKLMIEMIVSKIPLENTFCVILFF